MLFETERLFFREMTLEDVDTLALVMSDPESMKFYPHPFSREEVENWIKWNIDNYQKYGFGLWAVCLKESGEMIGDCGITMQQVENDLFPEIGYHLRKEFRGMGYATEAAKACARFAKERGMKKNHFIHEVRQPSQPPCGRAQRHEICKSLHQDCDGKSR